MADKGIKLTVDGFHAFNAELEKFLNLSTNVSSKLDSISRSFNNMANSLDTNKIDANIKRLSDAFKSFENIKLTDNSFFKVINDLNVKSRSLVTLSETLKTITFIPFREAIKNLNAAFRSLNVDKYVAKLSTFKDLKVSTNSFVLFFKRIDKVISEFSGITNPEKVSAFKTGISVFSKFLTLFEQFKVVEGINFKDLDKVVIEASKVLKTMAEFFADKNFLANKSNNMAQTESFFKTIESFSKMLNTLYDSYGSVNKISGMTINVDEFKANYDKFDKITEIMFGAKGSGYSAATGSLGSYFTSIKNAVNKSSGLDVSGNSKVIGVAKKIGSFIQELSAPLSQSDLMSRRLGNINMDGFNNLPGIADAMTKFIGFFNVLGTTDLNAEKAQENIIKLNEFISLVGERNIFDNIFKISNDIKGYSDKIKGSPDQTKTLGGKLKSIFGIFPVIGKSLFETIAPKTILERFKNINISSLENMSKFAESISKIIPVFSSLSTINLDTEKVEKSLKDFNKIIISFTGMTGLEKLQNQFSGFDIKKSPFQTIKTIFGGLAKIGIESLFPSNIISRFSKFSLTDITKFTDSLSSIEKFVRTFKKFEDLPNIDQNSIDTLGRTLTSISQIFTNKTFLDLFYGQMSKKPSLGFLEAFGKSVLDKIFRLPSIIERFGKFDETSIMGLSRFARSMIHLTNALKELNDASINEQVVSKNLQLVENIALKITKSEIFNSRSGIFSRLFSFLDFGKTSNSKTFEVFKNFSTGIKNAAESLMLISKLRIDGQKVEEFLKYVKQIFQGVKGILPNESFNSISKVTNVFSKLLSNISMKKTSKDMEKAGKDAADSYSKGAAKAWGIKSPSRVFIKFGNDIVSGLKIGMMGIVHLAKTVGGFLINGFVGALKRVISAIKTEGQEINNRFKSIFTGIQSGFRSLSQFAFGFNNIMQMMSNIGASGFIGASVKFESQMADVFKTISMDDLGKEQAKLFMEGFTSDIEELATSRGSTVSGMSDAFGQLTSIAVQAGSAGIAKEFMIDFVKTVGDLSQATDLSSESAGSSLASFATVTGTTEYSRLGSTLVALGNKFNATESKIVEFAQRLSGVAVGTEFTEANILALSSAMASVGIQAEAGGTSMTQLIDKITKAVGTGSGLQQFVNISKMSAKDFTDVWQEKPIEVIESLIEGFGEMTSTEMVRAFDSMGLEGIRLSDMIRRLAGSEGLLADSIKTANQGWEENTALTIEAEKRNLTAKSAIERVKNTFFLLGKTVGDFVLPGLVKVADFISAFNVGLSNMIVRIKPIIDYILPSIIKFFGYLTLGLTSTFSLVALLNNGFVLLTSSLVGSIGFLFKFFKFFTSPFNLLTGFLMIKVLPAILNTINREGKKTLEVFGDLFKSFGRLLSSIFNLSMSVKDLIGGIFGFRRETEALQESPFLNFLTNITDRFNSIAETVSNAISKIQFFTGLINGTSALLGGGLSGGSAPMTKDYSIKPGDTLSGISQALGISIEDLVNSNNITDPSFIIAGATLKIPVIPVDGDGNPIATPSDIITKTKNPLEALADIKDTDMFKTMFGDDSGALQRALNNFYIIGENITLAKNSGRDFVKSLKQFSSGDILGGLDSVKNGIAGIVGAILGIGNSSADSAQLDPSAMDFRGDSYKSTEGKSPFVERIRTYILDLRKMDLSETIQTVSDTFKNIFKSGLDLFISSEFVGTFKESLAGIVNNNELANLGIDVEGSSLETGLRLGFETIISGALTSLIGSPGYFIIGFTNALENDFLGLRSELEKSSIGNIIISSFGYLNDLITGVFESILSFGNDKLNGKDPLGMDFRGIFPDTKSSGAGDFLKQIDGFIKPISDLLTGVNAIDITQLKELGVSLGNFFSGLLQFGGASIGSLISFAQSVLPSLNTFFSGISNFITGASEGDFERIGTGISSMISAIQQGIGSLTILGLETLINFFEAITGKDLPDSNSFILKAVDAAQLLVDKFEQMVLNVELLLAKLTPGQAGVDALIRKITANDAARQFQDQFMVQPTYNFDPNQIINVGDFSDTITNLIQDPIMKEEFFASLTGRARDKFIESLNRSALVGTNINELMPFYKGIFGDETSGGDIFGSIFNMLNIEEKVKTLKSNLLEPFTNLFKSDVGVNGDSLNTGIFSGIKSLFQNIGLTGKTVDPNFSSDSMTQYGLIVVDSIKSQFSKPELTTSLAIIGGSISGGLTVGMMEELDVKPFSNAIIDDVKEQLGIHSPSTEFIKIGESVGEGFNVGLNSKMSLILETFNKIMGGITLSFATFAISFSIITFPIILSTQLMINQFNSFNSSIVTLLSNVNNFGTALAAFGLLKYTPIPIYQPEQRKYGGKINAGQTYQILEDNLPYETYKTKTGKTYFVGSEDGSMQSPLNSRYKPDSMNSGNGNSYNSVENISYNIPITFQNVPSDVSDANLTKISKTIGDNVKRQLEGNNRTKLQEKLRRRGLR